MVHTTSVSEVPGNGHEHPAPMKLDATAEVPEPRVKMEVSEGSSGPLYISYCQSAIGPVASVEQTTAAYAAYLARRSAAQASIPTTSFTQAPPISPRYAQAQPRGTPCVPPPSSTPETPTTHVKTEPLGRECTSTCITKTGTSYPPLFGSQTPLKHPGFPCQPPSLSLLRRFNCPLSPGLKQCSHQSSPIDFQSRLNRSTL